MIDTMFPLVLLDNKDVIVQKNAILVVAINLSMNMRLLVLFLIASTCYASEKTEADRRYQLGFTVQNFSPPRVGTSVSKVELSTLCIFDRFSLGPIIGYSETKTIDDKPPIKTEELIYGGIVKYYLIEVTQAMQTAFIGISRLTSFERVLQKRTTDLDFFGGYEHFLNFNVSIAPTVTFYGRNSEDSEAALFHNIYVSINAYL